MPAASVTELSLGPPQGSLGVIMEEGSEEAGEEADEGQSAPQAESRMASAAKDAPSRGKKRRGISPRPVPQKNGTVYAGTLLACTTSSGSAWTPRGVLTLMGRLHDIGSRGTCHILPFGVQSWKGKVGWQMTVHACLNGISWCRGRAAAKKEVDSPPKPAKQTRWVLSTLSPVWVS